MSVPAADVIQDKLLRTDCLRELSCHLRNGVPARESVAEHSIKRAQCEACIEKDFARNVCISCFVDEEGWGCTKRNDTRGVVSIAQDNDFASRSFRFAEDIA